MAVRYRVEPGMAVMIIEGAVLQDTVTPDLIRGPIDRAAVGGYCSNRTWTNSRETDIGLTSEVQ